MAGGQKEEKSFGQYYHLPAAWRVDADPESTGTPIVAFPIFRVRQDETAKTKTYPLYFSAELRIGASASPKEIARCLEPDPGYENQTISEEKMNGLIFKKFSFGGAGMMQYVQGVSYRIVHNNLCYAIEAVRTGSTYRDETFQGGQTEEELDGYFQQAASLIKSFNFTR